MGSSLTFLRNFVRVRGDDRLGLTSGLSSEIDNCSSALYGVQLTRMNVVLEVFKQDKFLTTSQDQKNHTDILNTAKPDQQRLCRNVVAEVDCGGCRGCGDCGSCGKLWETVAIVGGGHCSLKSTENSSRMFLQLEHPLRHSAYLHTYA